MKYLSKLRNVIPFVLITVLLSGCYTQFSNMSLDQNSRSAMQSEEIIVSKKSGNYYYWAGQESAYVPASEQSLPEKPHLYQESYYDVELLEKEAALIADNIKFRDTETASWYDEQQVSPMWKASNSVSEMLGPNLKETSADEENQEELKAFREKSDDHVYSTADFGWDQSSHDAFWGTRFGFRSKYNYNAAHRWYAVVGTLNRFQNAPPYFIGSRGPSFLSPFARFGTATIGSEAWAYQNFGFFASPFGSRRDCGGSALFGLAMQINGAALVGNNFDCLPFGIYSLMAYSGPDMQAYLQAYAPLFGGVILNHNNRQKYGYTESEILSLRDRGSTNRLTKRSDSGLYRLEGGRLTVINNSRADNRYNRGSLSQAGLNRNRNSVSARSGINRNRRSTSSYGSGIDRNNRSSRSGVGQSRNNGSGSTGNNGSSRGSGGSSSNGKRGGGN